MLQKLIKNEIFISILLIFLTTAITYGVRIPQLGYYHDDWYLLWSGQARGAASIIPLFSTDRPFMGVIYSYVYRLLGDSLLGWHTYALLWRFIGALAFFWILRLLWPREKYLTTLMTVLFVVYPGFLSQPNANTKQNHLYGFGTALLSIALMLRAMKTNVRAWKVTFGVLSVILAANYLFIYEYMIGFEATRLLLLGYVLFQNGYRKVRPLLWEVFKRFLPYLFVVAGFLYWRVFIFEGSRNATDVTRLASDYLSNLRYMSIRLILETLTDFLDTTVFAWFIQPYQLFSTTRYSNLGSAVLIAVISIALAMLYTFMFKKWWGNEYNEAESPGLMKEFIWIGALITLFAIFPVILSGRQVELGDAYKSYGLHPIGGVVLFVTGILLMFQAKFRRLFLFALIGISVSTQILNTDYWIQFWDYQREAWWQLTWRAPDIKDEALVVAYFPEGFRLQQDYEMWGPINLIYNPEPAEVPAIKAEVLTSDTAFNILKGEIVDNRMRDMKMHRDFGKLLLISYPSPSSCIHVIDGTLPVYAESDPLVIPQVGGLSRIDQIVPSGMSPIPPHAIFGSEPAHDWCYYYQKASLARQAGDWQEIGRLYDKVISLGLEPKDASEVIPFFEGLVNLGRYDDAEALYFNEIRGRVKMRYPLCTFMKNNPDYPAPPGYNHEKVYELLCTL